MMKKFFRIYIILNILYLIFSLLKYIVEIPPVLGLVISLIFLVCLIVLILVYVKLKKKNKHD